MALKDQLLDDFMHLLPEQQSIVFDFVHSLRQKQEKTQNNTPVPQTDLIDPIIVQNNPTTALLLPTELDSPEPSAYDVLNALGVIGCVKEGPKDLSYNKGYFDGYGQ